MARGSRIVASLAAVVVVPTVIALPVITMPAPEIRPVTPVVVSMPLAGVEPAALAASSAPAPVAATSAGTAVDADAVPIVGTTISAPTRPQVATVLPALAPAVVTSPTSTAPFTLVGVDWAGDTPTGTAVQVRVRENGVWGEWAPLDISADHGPDDDTADTADVAPRHGTDPLLTAPGSDGVQVRIDTPGGVAPTDAQVTLVDPQDAPGDETAVPTPVSTASAAGDPIRPSIITRAQWGADETLRNHGPVYTGPIQAAFLHHTASSSNYTPAQATAQVRALYGWYTQGLHYSDIAYNFLVDRYGRLYEGRAGGMDKNVLGGHTAGFNQNTFAVSAIGNFDTYRPTTSETNAITTSVAKLIAWKLALNHRDPGATATLQSNSGAGTSRYAVGQKARTPVISGHRDIGSTACPGRYLEAQLPRIRSLVKTYMRTQVVAPSLTPSVTAYGAAGTTLRGTATTKGVWKAEVFALCKTAPVRAYAGTLRKAGAFKLTWNQKLANGKPAPPGTYRVVFSLRNGSNVAYAVDQRIVVTPTPGAPATLCPPPAPAPVAKPTPSPTPTAKPVTPAKPATIPATFAFSGSGFGHGVGMSQYGARGMALAGSNGQQIVTHYYAGTTVAPVKDDAEVRINLQHNVKTVVLRGEPLATGGGRVEVAVTGLKAVLGLPGDVFTATSGTGKVTVTRTSAGKTTTVGTGAGVVVRWAGTRAPGTAGTVPTVLNVASSVAGLAGSGHRYRYGFVDIATTTQSPSTVEVVNALRLHDEYLLGIAEMSSSWPAAALQAQVLASRSYALSHYGTGQVRSACRCHLDDGGGPYYDQVFAGYAKESEAAGSAWRAAVASTWGSATTGLAILSAGKPITAFYFASSGGRTQNSADVWSSALPYATSVDDRWSLDKSDPWSAWVPRVKTQAQVAAAFGLPNVVRVDLADRFASGAVRTATAWSSTGAKATLKGELLRTRLALPSTWVTGAVGS